MLDNFTDSLMLNMNYNIDRTRPFDAAIRAVNYELPSVEVNLKTHSLKAQIENNEPGNMQLPKYWHGDMVFIRPLLFFLPTPRFVRFSN